MKNKVLLLLTAILLCFSELYAQGIDDTFSVEYDGYSLTFMVINIDPNEVCVYCEEAPEEEVQLFIPETVLSEEGVEFTVTTIAISGFYRMTKFVGELLLPNSIKLIEEEAFSECTGITGKLVIGENISSLGLKDNAFSGTNIDTLIVKSQMLTSINTDCFRNCESLKSVTLSNSITKIGNSAFRSCSKLTDITLPDNLETIEESAFRNTEISKLYVPKNVTTIEAHTFQNCGSLKEVILNSRLKKIGYRAFFSTELVTVISVSDSVPEFWDDGDFNPNENETPFGNVNQLDKNLRIYVPQTAYEDYCAGWSKYEKYIVACPVFINNGSLLDESNWSGKEVPAADADVLINADGIIESGKTFTVNSFYHCENGSITIEEGGQLIHNRSIHPVTAKKRINAWVLPDGYDTLTSGWYAISSPFGEIPIPNMLCTDRYELYRYNEAEYLWENVKNPEHPDFTTFEAGRGYLYASKNGVDLEITGIANTDAVSYHLTTQGEYLTGFHLIGNPFMHEISMGEGEGEAIDITNFDYAMGYYIIENAGGCQSKPFGRPRPIKPFSGIFVKALNETDLNIRKIPASQPKRGILSDNGFIDIKVESQKYSDEAHVIFSGGIGLDKINHMNPEIPMIYIPVSNTDYAVAVMDYDKTTEIPLSFKAMTMGEYTISIDAAKECNYTAVTLVDLQRDIKTDMQLEDYTFFATTNDNPERFVIKVSTKQQNAIIFANESDIIVKNIEGRGIINVYDVMGRLMANYSTNNADCHLPTNSMSKGVYLVSLIDDNGSMVEKVIIK